MGSLGRCALRASGHGCPLTRVLISVELRVGVGGGSNFKKESTIKWEANGR